MGIPIIVVCHNNYKYVRNTLFQLIRCNPTCVSDICIMDSKSTDPDTIAFLNEVDVPVLWNPTNSGPWIATWVNVHIYNSLPDRFILTDPDLQFNSTMPSDFVEQLSIVADTYTACKVGLALDISDFDKMYQSVYADNKTIYDHESQFWKDRVPNERYELYKAETDTTFCLHDKRGDQGVRLRIAGNFTAKHIPWYAENPLYSKDELSTVYLNTDRISTTGKLINNGPTSVI
jgi:hypothetical protein